jgi:hypothetical protein
MDNLEKFDKFSLNEAWEDKKIERAEKKIENAEVTLKKIIKRMGVELNEQGEILATTRFARILCHMAVKDGHFTKIGENKYILKK